MSRDNDSNPTRIALDAIRREWVRPYAEALITFAQHDEACTAEATEMYDGACRVCRLLRQAEADGVL